MERRSEPWTFRTVAVYENICSMKNSPSEEPRDQALRAALHDAALLAGLVQGVALRLTALTRRFDGHDQVIVSIDEPAPRRGVS